MLPDLPNSLWTQGTGKQPIPKSALSKIEAAIMQAFELLAAPNLIFVDTSSVRIEATADSPIQMMLCGFPNIMSQAPGQFVDGGLSDGRYRVNTANASCNLGLTTNLWGSKLASQWYCIYALAANADTSFILKAMPYIRVYSQTGQVITFGQNLAPASTQNYGFATNDATFGKIYVLSGASKGLMRTITANTATTLTYSGTALSLAQGDWFIILPAAGNNFRRLGDVYNHSSTTGILWIDDLVYGKFPYIFTYGASPVPYDGYWFCPLTVTQIFETGCGGGTGGASAPYYGNPAASDMQHSLSPVPGTVYAITIGNGRSGGGSPFGDGGPTSLGALRSLAGGVSGSSEISSWPLGPYGYSSPYGSLGGNGVLILDKAK